MSKRSCANCDLEVFDDNSDKCILHCEKDDWYIVGKSWNGKYLMCFWAKLKEQTKKRIHIAKKRKS